MATTNKTPSVVHIASSWCQLELKSTASASPLTPSVVGMCWKDNCGQCDKITWAGCGKHIEAALSGVPLDDLCRCPDRGGLKEDCPYCGEGFVASTRELMDSVHEAHMSLSPECQEKAKASA